MALHTAITPPITPPSAYNRAPATRLDETHRAWVGADAWQELRRTALDTAREAAHVPVIAIDTYPGVDLPALVAELETALVGFQIIDVESEAAKPIADIDTMLADSLTDDRVFGVLNHLDLDAFYEAAELDALRDRIAARTRPLVVVGWGARLAAPDADVLVLADLARWEIQRRQRAGAPNWRSANGAEDPLRKYKRGFFVEWRVADRHKRSLLPDVDYVLDTNASVGDAKLITGDTFWAGLRATAASPFRVVPFFDPGVWGGQWMKQVCGLDEEAVNYAWCFDGVPEENSLLLAVGDEIIELPASDLVFAFPRELLGASTFARFGAEFPIRFDLLDTMEGGNLSLQVHPLTDYIQNTFGMHYTQDESYYLLDAVDDAVVYLGLQTDVDKRAMLHDLERAATGEIVFPVDDYVNAYPAKKHDHFLIPAGTVHCSGAGSMVLEISATPFIFTFKMWDWERVGLDGKPRPIHLEHAAKNIEWDRDTAWTDANLVDRVEQIASGEGWTEERTGLHELEFIEVRRHWFTAPVEHNTLGTVNVLNLVEGPEAIIESPTGAFEPFVVHYAETFIVPAAVGPYMIRPHGAGIGRTLGTVKASVRGTAMEG